jgi:hypothetical protein
MRDESGLKGLLPTNRKQWKIFAFCTTVASVFWLLMTLSDSYINEIKLPVEYKNIPKDKYLLKAPPKFIKLQVKATGYEFLSGTDIGTDQALTLNFSRFESVKEGSVEKYYWLPDRNMGELNERLGRGKEIKAISTDSVSFKLDRIVKRKRKVRLAKNVDYDKTLFLLSEPLIYPDSVVLTGANSILNKLKYFPLSLSEEVIGDNIDKDIVMDTIPGVINVSPDSIRLFIGVDPIQQFEITEKVKCFDCPDSIRLKLFPPEVKLTFNCGTKQFGQIFPGVFKLGFYYKDIQSGVDKLPIQLIKSPDFIQDLKIIPARLEYIKGTR